MRPRTLRDAMMVDPEHASKGMLEKELDRLKWILKLGYELEVKWMPKRDSKISGEVKGHHIYVYDQELGVAKETLTHEFMDHAIAEAIKPYKEVTNRLISLINEDAYKRKEKVVESLCRLIREELGDEK